MNYATVSHLVLAVLVALVLALGALSPCNNNGTTDVKFKDYSGMSGMVCIIYAVCGVRL